MDVNVLSSSVYILSIVLNIFLSLYTIMQVILLYYSRTVKGTGNIFILQKFFMTENGCLGTFLCILQVVKELIRTKNGSGHYIGLKMALDIIWIVIVRALLGRFQMNVVKLNDKFEHNVKKESVNL